MDNAVVIRPFDRHTPCSLFSSLSKLAATPVNLVSPLNIAFAHGKISFAPKRLAPNLASNGEALSTSALRLNGSKGDEKGTELPTMPLEGIRGVSGDPATVLKMLQNDPLIADTIAIRVGFKLRVEAIDTQLIHISPSYRPTFQQMFWTTLVFSRNSSREVELTNGLTTNSATPLILPVAIDSIEPVLTEGTYQEMVAMIRFVVHTEGLLQLYPPPLPLLSRLWEVSVKVKNNRFARYLGTRSLWGLNDRIGNWVIVLIEWWAATHPQSLKDYQSSIFTFKSPIPGKEIVRNGHKRGYTGRLKQELRAAMGVELDDSKERMLLSAGFEFISMMRREMMLAVREEYEALVHEARIRGDEFWTREVDASYMGRERYKMFKAMMGREEPGLNEGNCEQSPSESGNETRSKSARKDLDRVRVQDRFSR